MKKDKTTGEENRILEKTLSSLEARRQAPGYVVILLLLLYFIASLTVSTAASSHTDFVLGDIRIPLYTFAGIFSALSNLCIIFLVIFSKVIYW